jgi:hypothetical protein
MSLIIFTREWKQNSRHSNQITWTLAARKANRFHSKIINKRVISMLIIFKIIIDKNDQILVTIHWDFEPEENSFCLTVTENSN